MISVVRSYTPDFDFDSMCDDILELLDSLLNLQMLY